MTVAIELTRTTDAPELVQALKASGLRADMLEDCCELRVFSDSVVSVEHVVEAWAASRGLPFVLHLVSENRVVLAPPAS